MVLGSALLALLLPAGPGLLLAAATVVKSGDALLGLGIALLASSDVAAALRPLAAPRTVESPAAAWRITGTWRQPPGSPAHLATAEGPLAVALASGLSPPGPGTPVEVLARWTADRPPVVVSLQTLGPARGAWLDRWAMAAQARVRQLVDRRHVGLVSALVLGRRDELPFPLKADCIATGTVHLLALSGLHVALLILVLESFTGRGGRLATPLLVGFVALAGSGPTLVRAATGWLLLESARRCGRRGSGLHRLTVVALLMELWNPGLLSGLSPQLSFLSVAGLIGAARATGGAWTLLGAPAGAFLATAPLCVETFGRVQPLGVLVTPLLVPLVGLVLGLGLLAIVPLGLLRWLDPLTGALLDLAASSLTGALAWLGPRLPVPVTPPALPVPGWVASLAVVAALHLAGGWREGPATWSRRLA